MACRPIHPPSATPRETSWSGAMPPPQIWHHPLGPDLGQRVASSKRTLPEDFDEPRRPAARKIRKSLKAHMPAEAKKALTRSRYPCCKAVRPGCRASHEIPKVHIRQLAPELQKEVYLYVCNAFLQCGDRGSRGDTAENHQRECEAYKAKYRDAAEKPRPEPMSLLAQATALYNAGRIKVDPATSTDIPTLLWGSDPAKAGAPPWAPRLNTHPSISLASQLSFSSSRSSSTLSTPGAQQSLHALPDVANGSPLLGFPSNVIDRTPSTSSGLEAEVALLLEHADNIAAGDLQDDHTPTETRKIANMTDDEFQQYLFTI
ncbi:hypothetical protein FA95DRAFT_1129822 [Auriscalpium vulgare]|uniref:Uncharacterized protein n=1 Tax=Auriscalpium vulgare TaxID=40419 RepID=A0ACB8RUX9_9AGAM|nr:hypothetical protein FA95DRAFT_1129822 [Auriscalpium vulgare]